MEENSIRNVRLERSFKWSVVIATILTISALVNPETVRADVTACVQTSNGNLRLVNGANQCKVGETPLTLSTPAGSSPRASNRESGTHPTGITSCVTSQYVFLTLPLVLTEPSTILAFGNAGLQREVANTTQFQFLVDAELLSGNQIVARRLSPIGIIEAGSSRGSSAVSGPLLSFQTGDFYTAAPGSYTLRLMINLFFLGECGIPFNTIGDSQLSFVTQPAN